MARVAKTKQFRTLPPFFLSVLAKPQRKRCTHAQKLLLFYVIGEITIFLLRFVVVVVVVVVAREFS